MKPHQSTIAHFIFHSQAPWLRANILALLAVFVFSLNGFAQLQFQNIQKSDSSQIQKIFPEVNTTNPPLSVLDNVIRYLAKLDAYSSIQVIKTAESQYILTAVPLKKIGEIEITGNSEIDDDDALLILGLKKGANFNSGALLSAGEKIKEHYGKLGFLNTIVSFDTKPYEKNDINVLINVRERDPCRVANISVDTSNSELKRKIESKLRRFKKKNFSEEVISDIENTAKEYLADNRYLNARFEQKSAEYNKAKTSVNLQYTLNSPYSYQIIINGSQKYTEGTIKHNMKLNELSTGSQELGQEFTSQIREFYINRGFPTFQSSYQEKIDEKNFIKILRFDVVEGPQVKIESLEVIGRISQPSRYYSKFIFNNSTDNIHDKLFVRNDLDIGLRNLITDLNNKGFLKAKIQSTRVDFNDRKNRALITVVLDEGPLTQLTRIKFEGVSSFSEDLIISQLRIKPQSPLRLNELEQSLDILKQYYYDHGFLEMKVLNEDNTLVEYDEQGLNASVNFRIKEGPQIYVRSIVLEGNSFTKDYVILRELGIEPGELLTPEVLSEGEKRLDKLAIFSRIELKTLEANTNVSRRTLMVYITERNPGLFKVGAGLTNKRKLTARGFAGLSYNNIRGTARAVSVRATVENNLAEKNRLEYETTISYLEPFLFTKRIRGRVSYTHSEKITEGGAASTSALDRLNSTDGLKLTAEKDITSNIKISWLAWAYESNEISEIPTSGPLQRLSRLDVAYLGPSIELEYRDNPFLPTDGYYAKWDSIFASPDLGSSKTVTFLRTQAAASHYYRIMKSPKWIWANSVSGGYEKNYNNRDDGGIPANFAFFLGGYSTVRGYSGSPRDRIPNNTEFPITNDQSAIHRESAYQLYKSEIRFPIYGILGGVAFFDAGQVDVHQGQPLQMPFRRSYGLGIRLNTPVGPIVLDYGKKVNKLDYESSDAWHFSFGTF